MATTLTTALEIVNQLAEEDREKLFNDLRERRRNEWLGKIEAQAEETHRLRMDGKLPAMSSRENIEKWIDRTVGSDAK